MNACRKLFRWSQIWLVFSFAIPFPFAVSHTILPHIQMNRCKVYFAILFLRCYHCVHPLCIVHSYVTYIDNSCHSRWHFSDNKFHFSILAWCPSIFNNSVHPLSFKMLLAFIKFITTHLSRDSVEKFFLRHFPPSFLPQTFLCHFYERGIFFYIVTRFRLEMEVMFVSFNSIQRYPFRCSHFPFFQQQI